MRYNELTYVEDIKRSGYHRYCMWRCSCGELREAWLANVRNGKTKTCKVCAKATMADNGKVVGLTHGESKTRLYKCWQAMKDRCNNRKGYEHLDYPKEWEDFLVFKADVAASYFEGAELDRIDNTRGYSAANVQWLTRQAHASKTSVDRKDALSD